MKWYLIFKLIVNVYMYNLFEWIFEKLLLCCSVFLLLIKNFYRFV